MFLTLWKQWFSSFLFLSLVNRYGQFVDPFGHKWSVSTPLSPERAEAAKKAHEEWMKSCAAEKKLSSADVPK